MRFVFLVADLETRKSWWQIQSTIRSLRLSPLAKFMQLRFLRVNQAFGGTLNIMRQCQVARNCGIDAVLATMSGEDTYGDRGIAGLPYMRWQDRRHDDVCIVPDFVTELINEVHGPVIAYLQSPLHVRANFNFRDERVTLWTDSPFMLEICQSVYPGKEIEIVPNIIDDKKFPFIPQSEREPGLIFAFPRKGREYIAETQKYYREMGGQFWKFELIDGLSIRELAEQFSRPQAFLASAEVEGCALPPQESMASGIVVVGKNARGANFCMEHGETAMIADTPEEAARCLFALENSELRDSLTQNAYAAIKRYFPSEEPTQFWQKTIHQFMPV
jgi:glycosyltransferase involved in cell wall biosynthesis